jgi:chitinase
VCSGSPDDRKNFNELLLAIRVALNEYQTQTGDAPIGGGAFGLTAALPCGPANIDFLDVAFLSQVLSGMNLMTFDFHNEQEPLTGVNAPLYDQGWGEKVRTVAFVFSFWCPVQLKVF